MIEATQLLFHTKGFEIERFAHYHYEHALTQNGYFYWNRSSGQSGWYKKDGDLETFIAEGSQAACELEDLTVLHFLPDEFYIVTPEEAMMLRSKSETVIKLHDKYIWGTTSRRRKEVLTDE